MRTFIFIAFAINFRIASVAQHLQPDFGNNGVTSVNFFERTNDNFHGHAIMLDTAQNILVGGDINYESVFHRMQANGGDDMRFGKKAFYFFDYGATLNNRIEDILKDKSGRIIGIGYATPITSHIHRYNATSGAALIRLLPDGTPDLSFGNAGKTLYVHRNLSLWAFKGVIQEDGKIVVACRAHTDPSATRVWNRIALLRLTADGNIDNSFGTDGVLVIPDFSTWSLFYGGQIGLALQPDGKIILADIWSEPIFTTGYTTKASPAIYRISSNGRLDSSFASNRRFSSRFGFDNMALNSVVVLPDGKMVAAGHTKSETNETAWMAFRLYSNGKIDSSFGTGGMFRYTQAGWREQSIGQIGLQDDGKLMVAAFHNDKTNGFLDVFRLNSSGNFDSSFANHSVLKSLPMIKDYFFANAKFCVGPDKSITAMAYTSYYPLQNVDYKGHLIAHFTKDGVLTTKLNANGYKLYYNMREVQNSPDYNFGSTDRLAGFAKLQSGKLMAVGTVYRNSNEIKEIGMARMQNNGKLDSSFGQFGKKLLAPSQYFYFTHAFQILKDDWMLISTGDYSCIKVDSAGRPDLAFGDKGKVAINLPEINGHRPTIRAFAQQQNGKVLVLTESQILRLNENGSIDNSFGNAGIVLMVRPFGVRANNIKVQPDGKIVVSGAAIKNFIFRCNPDGMPDNTFGAALDGYAEINIPISESYEPPFASSITDFEFQSDGSIVILGLKDRAFGIPELDPKPNYRDIILHRITASGLIDYTFGGYPDPTGYAGTTHLDLPFEEEMPGDLLITQDDKIIVGGYFSNGVSWDIGLVQLNQNGRYDNTCVQNAYILAGSDNIVQNRFFGNNLRMQLIRNVDDDSYLVACTNLGQGSDYAVFKLFSPSSPYAEYSNFNAVKGNNCFEVELDWETNYECALDSFYVEYSTDGTTFIPIGGQKAINASGAIYHFIHESAQKGDNYYRLRLVNNSLSYAASDIKKVSIGKNPLTAITWSNTSITRIDSTFDISLKWNTTFEDGTTDFILQMSTDSVLFKTIHTLGGKGIATSLTAYSTAVRDIMSGIYFFRIIATGSDCREYISEVLSIHLEKGCNKAFTVAPNPVSNKLTVNIPCEKGDIRIVSTWGQILSIIRDVEQPSITINCMGLAPATYYIQFIGKKVYTAKFIKL